MNFPLSIETQKNISQRKPDIRRVKDVLNVLYDQKWAKEANPELEIYYMYRGVNHISGLRYDITLIPALMLGEEYNKTWGHYHLNCGEMYKVLEGEGLYLMQKKDPLNEKKILDVYFVEAKKGDYILIGKQYGHFTINKSDETLEMANWSSPQSINDYKPVDLLRGACYYYTKSGFIKNRQYESMPELREEKPLKKMPDNLDFLK